MDNKKLLLEYNLQDIIKYIVEETGVTIQKAIMDFYNSAVFEKLQEYETGLYRESSAYIYELYRDEQKYGKIIQMEV